MLVRTGLFLGCKDVSEFIDKAVKEALKKEEKEVMLMSDKGWMGG